MGCEVAADVSAHTRSLMNYLTYIKNIYGSEISGPGIENSFKLGMNSSLKGHTHTHAHTHTHTETNVDSDAQHQLDSIRLQQANPAANHGSVWRWDQETAHVTVGQVHCQAAAHIHPVSSLFLACKS